MSRLRTRLSRYCALGAAFCALIALMVSPIDSSSSCLCSTSDVVNANAASCCVSEVEEKSCCSSNQPKSCCCSTASDCNCLGCECDEPVEPISELPFAPGQTQIDLVFAGHVGLSSEISTPWPEDRESVWPETRSNPGSTLTALETCVILSRFTC